MSSMQLAIDLGDDAVLYTLAASIAFLTAYLGLIKGWRRNEMGRSLVVLDAALTLALGPALLHRLFGVSNNDLFFTWYYAVSIALVGTATWWRVWITIKRQYRGRTALDEQAVTKLIHCRTGVDQDTVTAVLQAYRAI